MTLRVIVADDHEAVREGLRWMLDADDRIRVVAEAPDGRNLIELVGRVPCDAIRLDLSMPDMDGHQVPGGLEDAGGCASHRRPDDA